MSEANEDAPVSSLHKQQSPEEDLDDEPQDFRFLAALTANSGKLPKRGEKDFEPHGTNHQAAKLEQSLQAAHDALAYTRCHTAKSHVKAYYYGEGVGDTAEFEDELKEENRGTGLGKDHVIAVEHVHGTIYRTVGKQAGGKLEGGKSTRLWLLPEEALFLVERGSLDLRWPTRSSLNKSNASEEESRGEEGVEDGIPMSFQAAYAMLIGHGTGKIDLERYQVYTNLKRAGYAVLRAPEWDPSSTSCDHSSSHSRPMIPPQSVFTRLWEQIFAKKEFQHQPHGPLVQPGLYRSYEEIFRRLAIIPTHKPQETPKNPLLPLPPPSQPYSVVYHTWKASNLPSFKKSNPGIPDFLIVVTSARNSNIPTMTEITTLLESTPFTPPPSHMEGPGRVNNRLKHGYRSFVLGIVDQGMISYLTLSEGAFRKEKLYEKRNSGNLRGGKLGGRARGSGRGR